METRRKFLIKSVRTMAALSIPTFAQAAVAKTDVKLKTNNPSTALALWYSQTGHTERVGKLITRTWKKLGLKAVGHDIREFDSKGIGQYDLLLVGTPVYYSDVPGNVKQWLQDLPEIKNMPVAAFATFGGPGGSEHNTACAVLELLNQKGGVPVGMETFGNMSTYAPTWSIGNEERILKYSHLPNQTTFKKARDYGRQLITNVNQEKEMSIDRECSFADLLKYTAPIWLSKTFLICNHRINRELCIECGTCTKKCPVGAISISTGRVDTDRCIACFGCINNCPEGAVEMTYMGQKVYGFNELLSRNKIRIMEPDAI